ncbi:MAG: Ig-like domain-containing protein, partial [Actinomycetota bacterium]|nr:Ig-like domain-containing protein [Actinomycetota bacterium]
GGGAIGFASPTFSINETAGTGSVSVTVTRTGGDEAAFVHYATGDGAGPDAAAAGEDYEATSGTLAFRADQTTRSFTVPILDDPIDEADETIGLTLSEPAFGFDLGEQTVSELTITDDDDSRLSVDDRTVTEGDSGTQNMTFTATLSAPHSRPVTVGYTTSDRSATAPSDYESRSGQLTFEPDQLSRTITVPVVGETRDETDETFRLAFSGIRNASIGDGRGTGTIEDDDTTDTPAAIGDSYTAAQDKPLRVAAPGLLSNDTDPDGDALTALEVTDPAHGEVFVRTDGSFAYFPDEGYLGADSFTYRASDGSATSDPATVKIAVKDLTKPTVVDTRPLNGATVVLPGANVSAAFSEAMRVNSVSGAFKLYPQGSETPLEATVTYDAANEIAVLNPSINLERGVTYRAVVTTGARDLAGNRLDQDQDPSNGNQPKAWFFTVRN